MRPLYLEMTAFGSYAAKTAVPFEAIKESPFLVTGDTGAGKTTIFDAIMFALYGVASGGERSTDMLHCDYVPKSEDTVVTLRFSQSGKVFTAERRIHFQKKQGQPGQYGDGKIDAVLREPERAPTKGARNVTERVEELLGLNAEQFRKIIMLAQGKFKEFLDADSNKKNDILGKLFDSSEYIRYQNLLYEAREKLRKRRDAQSAELKSLMSNSFLAPEDEDPVRYLPDNPALLDNLGALISREREVLEEMQTQRDAIREEIDRKNGQLGAAEAVNAQLDDLSRQRELLAALEAQDEAMAQRRQALLRAEASLHRARPAIDAFEQAYRNLNRTQREIEELQAQLVEEELAVQRSKEAVDGDEAAKKEADELGAKQRQLGEQLPRYRDLAQRRKEKADAETAAQTARDKAEKTRTELIEAGAELQRLKEKLAELDDADSAALRCEARYEEVKKRLDALDGRDGLRENVEELRRSESTLEGEKRQLLTLTAAVSEAQRQYDGLYQRFLAGQADLLARELRTTLEQDGEAECPVCCSRLCREHLPKLAILSADTPDADTVERARQAAAAKEKTRAGQAAKTERLSASVEAGRQSIIQKAGSLLSGLQCWEQLTGGTYLAEAIASAKSAEKEAMTRKELAAARKRERERGRQRLPVLEAEEKQLRDSIETLLETQRSQAASAREAEAAIGELLKQLSFPDEQSARAEIERLRLRLNELRSGIEVHENALKEANQRRDRIMGTLDEKRSALTRMTQEQERSTLALDAALREAGFADPAEAERALAPIGDADGEIWLRTEQKALNDHESAKTNTRGQIDRLSRQTEGKTHTDLGEIGAQIEALKDSCRQADTIYTRQFTLQQNHEQVFRRAEEAIASLSKTDGAWKRLDRLAPLAVGSSSDSGKLSFDRYVMGAVFREVLEMANRRMELMSGGRYELVHKTAADRRNAAAGLEVEVLDNSTGRRRGSGSLSGGETFFTSLALALGLSDVVQNHAGGRQMEALFIDEGFGTLSEDYLDKAMDMLRMLTEGDRLVGVISHVSRLDESISQKIRVRSSEKGSTLTLEIS